MLTSKPRGKKGDISIKYIPFNRNVISIPFNRNVIFPFNRNAISMAFNRN